jgi:hypothetical protein
MAELEKVIKGLELCLQGDSNFCELSCPYYHQCGAFYENNEALLKDALSLLKAQEPGWVSVKDRLPEKSGRYLVYAKEGERETHRTIAPFHKAFHLSGRMAYWKVTHWMPLPEPPKEET